MHELYQNPTLGAYSPAIHPAAINPLAALAFSPGLTQWGQPGYNPFGSIYGQIHPQQLQLAAIAAQAAQAAQLYGTQQHPLHTAWHQQQLGGLQNPYATSILQNPLVAAGLQNPFLSQQNPFAQANPYLNPILAQQYGGLLGPQAGGQPFGQIGSPYGQINPTLAPQSWVGPGYLGGGQVNPLLQQLVSRQFNPGYPTWGI